MLLIAGVFGYGWLSGANSVHEDWDNDTATRLLSVSKFKNTQARTTERVVTEYVYVDRVVTQKADTIIKEVPVYVKVDHPPLSGGFRLLFDAAATNQPADAAKIADAEPVSAQDVAATTAENFKTCHQQREQLIALQTWVTEQTNLSNGH